MCVWVYVEVIYIKGCQPTRLNPSQTPEAGVVVSRAAPRECSGGGGVHTPRGRPLEHDSLRGLKGRYSVMGQEGFQRRR